MSTLQERIHHIRDIEGMPARGWKAQLARIADVTPAAVTMWDTGMTTEMSPKAAVNIERELGWSAAWLMTGASPERHNPPNMGVLTYTTVQEFTVPPLTKWAELMKTNALAALIRIAAPDDALADEAPRGAELIMSTTDMKPQRGDIVLVRDSRGALYLRRYAEGRGAAWRAVTGRGDGVYLELDSITDGLVLVALAEWVKPRRG